MFLKYKQKLLKDLKNKKIKPIYFLMGEERYLISNLYHSIEFFFKEKKILYGYDIDINNLILIAKQISISVSVYNLIIVKEAQYLSNSIENLYKLLISPIENTILIICYNNKVIDKNTNFYKKIKKNGFIYQSVKLKKKEIFNIIKYEFEYIGYIITDNTVSFIIKNLGEDLYKINNEINKIILNKKRYKNFLKKKIDKYSKLETYIVEKQFFTFIISIIKFNFITLMNKKKYPLNKILSYIRESDTERIYNYSLNDEYIIKLLLYKLFNN
ncbi:DNA polymerase III subunit delta [Candidatus Karelsulcia muelleri]|uniref:DNA polymerase III delta N-terminal domain-containing protein n=1 Tax=Candidatus Karelsulcia muelleri TaxID=336810 RepID=A0A3A1MR52_9FLAO|nr:hypothetical protein [Candidatus Karelsulcia muelleri]RIU85703.1 hypothetical protein D2A33_01340 [Candidatus Karelsulcia muelleri]